MRGRSVFLRVARLAPIVCALLAGPGVAAVVEEGDLLVVDHGLARLVLVDGSSGDREVVSSSFVGAGTAFSFPVGVEVGSDGTIYVLDRPLGPPGWRIFRVEAATGDRSVVASPSVGSGPNLVTPNRIALDGNGDLVVTDEGLDAVVRVDPGTGARTVVSSASVGSGQALDTPIDIRVSGSGTLYVTSFGFPQGLLEIDPVTGDRAIAPSASGSGPSVDEPAGLSLGIEEFVLGLGSPFYVSEGGPTDGRVLTVGSNGARAVLSGPGVGAGPTLAWPTDVLYTRGGRILAIDVSLAAILEIDPATGDRTLVSGGGAGAGPAFASPGAAAEAPLRSPRTGDIFTAGVSTLYRVDPFTGDRVAVAGFGFGFGPNLPGGFIALREDGVGFDMDGWIARVDLQSGDRETLPYGGADLDVEPGGTLIVVENYFADEILRIDPAAGTSTVVSTEVPQPTGVAVDEAGTLFVTSAVPGSEAVYAVDPSSGSATFVAGLPDRPLDIEIEPDGSLVVMIAEPRRGLYRVPTGFFSSNTIGAGPTFSTSSWGFGVEPDGSFVVPDDDFFVNWMLRVDPMTGDRTVLTSNSVAAGPPFDGGIDAAVFVPEPGALWQLGSGVGLLVLLARRRRRTPDRHRRKRSR